MLEELIEDLVSGGDAAGLVPEALGHMKRFPFLFLVDRSGSTGQGGSNADIHAINVMMNEILAVLRSPPPGDLRDAIEQVDGTVMSYSDDVRVDIDWTLAQNITTGVHWTADGGTSTGHALNAALMMIGKRLRYYDANAIPCGLPHIIHVTDGAPSDMTLGTPLWNELQGKRANLTGTGQREKAVAKVLHFVAPNGCCIQPYCVHRDETGRVLTGQDVLARLTGPKSVYELSKGAESLPELVKLVTAIISKVSELFGQDAEQTAQDFVKGTTAIAATTSSYGHEAAPAPVQPAAGAMPVAAPAAASATSNYGVAL